MKKRIISLLLCLCMVFSLLPTVVFASETETSTTVYDWDQENACYKSTTDGLIKYNDNDPDGGLPETLKTLYSNINDAANEEDKAAAIDSANAAGTITDNLADRLKRLVHVYTSDELTNGVSLQDSTVTAKLNGDELVISGTGPLPTYTRYNAAFWAPADNSVAMRPWNTEKLGREVSSVRFAPGITEVGSYAFYYQGRSDITSATFDKNLKLHLPDSLEKMSQATFMSLNASDIAVPSSVTTLSTRLFGKLSRLYVLGDPEIVVPSASTSSFAVGSDTTVYAAKDSKLSSKSGITNMTLVKVDAIGACGTEEGYTSELVWMVQGDTLTIAAMDGGNGMMVDYTDGTSAPWNAYASQIRKIVLSAGVANIGKNAFAGLNSLTNVTVPDSVQIDEDAESPFGTTLKSISFSFNEGSSFANWLKKNGIDHSADVDELGRKKLTKAENELFHAYIGETDIAAKMTKDGTLTISPKYSLFNNTEVPRIEGYRKDNTAFPWFDEAYGKTFDENDYKGSTKDLVNLKEIVWDDGITDTGAYLFNDANDWPTGAVKFRIPDSVTKIGGALIGNKSAGTTCVIPENVTSVGFWFGGKDAKDVYILNPDLTDFPVVKKGETPSSSGGDSMARNIGCGFAYTVHVKKDSAAYNKLATGNYTIQPHTDMGACGAAPYSSEVFWLYDENTKTLTIKGSGEMKNYASTYAAPWAIYDVETVTVDDGITHIGDYAFASLKKIKQENVTLGESVTVGTNAFAQPDAQGRLPLPLTPDLYYNDYIGTTTIAAKMSKNGVITIYPTDLSKDTKVPGINGYQGDNTLYPWYAVYGKTFDKEHWDGTGVHASEIKEIVFADGLTEIGGYLFNDVKEMPTSVKVRIPDSVTMVGGALVGTKNHGASIATGVQMTGVGFWYAGKATNVYILNPDMTGIPFPATGPKADLTRTIAHATGDKVAVHVKENSDAYSTLTKEGTVYTNVITHTALGVCGVVPYSSEAFWTYDEDSKTLTVLGDGAIRDYDSADAAPWSKFDVETLVVQDGITRIGNNAFAALKNLKSVNVDGSVTEVADNAFATENGEIVDGLKSTQFLTSSAAMKAWLEEHGTSALGTSGVCGNYRWSVESGVLTIKVNVTDADTTDVLGAGGKTAAISDVIAEGAPDWVAYKSIITKVQLGYGITGIGANAFKDMPVLASVELPSTLEAIGAEAFVNTPKLTKLYLPKNATEVAENAFGTESSDAKNLTIQISPIAADPQKNLKSQGNTTITVDSSKNLNVLLIGNSYFGALSGYLKDIARGLGATDAMIANYYFGGYSGNLESYVNYIKAGKVSYQDADKYSGYKENGNTNHSYNNNPLSMGIEAEDWDYVVMETWGKNEPAGANGVDKKLSQDPNLTTLKEYILKYAPQAEVSLYHVYSCRYLAEKEEPVETLTEQWQRYVDGADDGLASIVTHVIPASTLIQNARLTYLNADGGDLLRNPKPADVSKIDITHLNPEGDYINAIMMYETLTGKSAAGFDHGTFDNHKEAFYHKLVDVTKAAGMKKLTYAYVKHNNTITYYDSLSAAANAAVAGDTLSLLAMPKSETPLTLELKKGITVETFGSSENHTIVLTNGGNITENGLVAFAGCEVDDSAEAAAKAIAVNPVTGALQEVEIELPPVKVKVYVTPYADGNPVTPAQTSTVLGTYDAAKGAFFSGTLTTRQNLSGTYEDESQNPFKAVIQELETDAFTTPDATHYPFEQIAWDTLTKTEDGYEMNGTVLFYDVQFDVNGGDALNPNPSGYYLPGTVITLPTPTRTGYSFVEWKEAETSGDGGEIDWTPGTLSLDDEDAEAANEATYKVDGAVTLVAQWQPNKYTVSFDANGGEVEQTSKTVTFDDAYGELPTPTRENYRFVGWYLNGVRVTKDTIVKTAANHTLLAGWSRSYYALTINYVDRNGKKLEKSYEASVALGADFSVPSPKIKGYKLKDKDDAVIEGTMTAEGYTYDVVYIKKSSGGSGVQIESPNKPKQDNSLKFNMDDHFAYVNGYPDGTVKPTGDVTRAEVAAILYRVMDADCVKTYETTRCSFSDVVRGDWFNLYVATLENADVIVDTRTNGKFRPNEAITRAELAAMLAQFADIKSAANSFNDVSARHWASDEIAVCAKMGWINGYPDGSFRPDATITRAEMMAMINRALARTPKSADDLLSGMKTWSDNANVNAWYYLDVQEATNSHTYTKSGSHETWKKLR